MLLQPTVEAFSPEVGEKSELPRLDLDKVDFRSIRDLFVFDRFRNELFSQPTLQIPKIIEDQLVLAKKQLVKARKLIPGNKNSSGDPFSELYEYPEGQYETRKVSDLQQELSVNRTRIDQAKKYLIDQEFLVADEEYDDETIITNFERELLSNCNNVYTAELKNDRETSHRTLLKLREMLEVIQVAPHHNIESYHSDRGIRIGLRRLNYLLGEENEEIQLLPKQPQVGKGFLRITNAASKPVEINTIPADSVVFIESIGCFGHIEIEGDTHKLIILMEPGYYFPGLGSEKPQLEIVQASGKVIPLDYLMEVPENKIENTELTSAVLNSLKKKGLSTVETHIFDRVFLFDALLNGNWNVASVGGFQVETKDLEDEIPKFSYFKPHSPFFSFIFNGDNLEKRYPKSITKNMMSGFHLIHEGLEFSDTDFIYCIIPPLLKEKIINWIDQLDGETRKKMIGDKDPNQFFISSASDLS